MPGDKTHVYLVHGYSRRNHGDGLLVDLSLSLIREALGPDARISVVCMDASSFSDMSDVHQLPSTSSGFLRKLRAAGQLPSLVLGAGQPPRLAPTLKEDPDLIVAVGGGYMRLENAFKQQVKTFLAHGLTLNWAVKAKAPTIYLPQSIGPLTGAFRPRIMELLRGVDRIYVRDDRSLKLLEGYPNVLRAPDLAVIAIANELEHSRSEIRGNGRPAIVARQLSRPAEILKGYESRLLELKAKLPELTPVVQSEGRGNNDPGFYAKLGWGGAHPSLLEYIASDAPPFVISVRLHGALEAIRAGVPAIHLSYERKGFSAFDDLGLSRFVHNANNFDVSRVLEQAAELSSRPEAYWENVHSRAPVLKDARAALVSEIASRLGSGVRQ